MQITVLVLGLLLASTAGASAQARPKDEAGIHSGVAAYEAAVNARDFHGLGAVFTPDADLIFFDSPRRVGREAIRKSHTDGIAEWPPTLVLPGLAWIIGEISGVGLSAALTQRLWLLLLFLWIELLGLRLHS